MSRHTVPQVLRAAAAAALCAAAVSGCGSSDSKNGISEAEKAKVENQTKALQESASTLGSDLGQCLQDAVGDLISGGGMKLNECVDKNLNERASLAKSTDGLVAALVPKASGECSTKLKALAGNVKSLQTSAQRVINGLADGFDAADAQGIAEEVGKIVSVVQSDWSAVRTACK